MREVASESGSARRSREIAAGENECSVKGRSRGRGYREIASGHVEITCADRESSRLGDGGGVGGFNVDATDR